MDLFSHIEYSLIVAGLPGREAAAETPDRAKHCPAPGHLQGCDGVWEGGGGGAEEGQGWEQTH